MTAALLERLLEGALPDPDGGPPLTVPTRAVIIAPSVLDAAVPCLKELALGRRFAVVSDGITHRILGARVERALASFAAAETILLPDRPHADEAMVETIRRGAAHADALIAVGAGTINDLCKYAGALDRKPYAVFATAPSMNGYTSVNAAITVQGHKTSRPAQGALAVFMDLDILCAAPPRLIRAGLGDSLCRPTAQADWLLAHLLLDQPYRLAPFALLEHDEEALFAEPGALCRGEPGAMTRLARTLILSGFGMTLAGGSYPASQGEHLISHYAEMMGDPGWPLTLHGEQIGVATLTMARLQERMLADGPPRLEPCPLSEADFVAHFGAALGRSCWESFRKKKLDAESTEQLNGRLAERWPAIRERIARIHRPAGALERVLEGAGAPSSSAELPWPRAFYRQAVRHAREIRDRFTFLDLAADSGFVPESIEP